MSAAQSVTSIRGRVTDATDAVVPGAHIVLTSAGTGAVRTGVSDPTGEYQFQQLMPGKYSLRVDATGFTSVVKENIALLVASPATLNITLKVEAANQTVDISESSQPLLNTTDATLGNAFDSKQVSTLPIEGRNVPELLSLQPGVVFLGKAGNSSDDSRSGAVNGARSDQSNVTLDGVDVNDENSNYAFNSVLRVTQDSVAEFRVTTSNPVADAGRGSGAQVALITKSGTNQIHGTVYEYNRNAAFTANDYFLKQTEVENNLPNKPQKLIRNIFGGSVGGPILKDKVFYFLNYEGGRIDEASAVSRSVPTDSMRSGVLNYTAADGSTVALSAAQIQGLDPLGIGDNTAMLQLLQSYPEPNDFTAGDPNFAVYRFAAPIRTNTNTYIARLDWNVARNHTLFWRGNLMGDNATGSAPQFPGQPYASTDLTNSKGFAAGYTWVITPNVVNNFRWGLTRQGGSSSGISNQPSVGIARIDSPVAFSRTSANHIPVMNFVDDVAWIKGQHNLSFNANIRMIDDWRSSNQNSFPRASINVGWLQPSKVAGSGKALDPTTGGYKAVDSSYDGLYDSAILDLVGVVSEVDAVYNYDKKGNPIALGAPLLREYKWHELDFSAQDSWKATPNLTLTAGLHYAYLQPPAEVNGTQLGACVISGSGCTPYALSQFLSASANEGATGGSASNVPNVSFDLNGRYNSRADFWQGDKKDFSPRVAFAYAPEFFGVGKTSIRGGYSLIFDHFGAGIVNTFDNNGTYGLSSDVSNPAGVQTVATAPRFTGISSIPTSLLPAAPPAGGFPATPDPSAFAISWGLDSKIKTPYSHVMDLSVQRQISASSSLEVSYVGRLGRRLMEQEDVAMPLNLTAAGTDYFTAASNLAQMVSQGVDPNSVGKAAYWETLFAPLAGQQICDPSAGPANPSATQNVYCLFQQNAGNETNALFTLDLPSGGVGAGTSYPAYRFYHDQYSALYAWRSIGNSSYHALQATYKQHLGNSLQADFNYTFSRSMDVTSQAERTNTSGGNNNAQIINTWKPNQLYGVSDYDVTHQINANWLWDLPVGRGRHFLGKSNRLVDEIIGQWRLTGIFRITSGLPFAVDNGSQWPTNWDIEGFAVKTKPIPAAALKRGSGQQRFADPAAVFSSFRAAYPGESGTRNPLRGDGYYRWDAGLDKTFKIYDRADFEFRGEVFNLTNSVRFDPHSISASLNQGANFGIAYSALAENRVMQVSGRIQF